MEFKGTKGKWEVEDLSVRFSIHKEEYDGLFIDCWGDGIANTSDEQAKANALLISKAPEMLEMLEKLYQQVDFSFESFGSDTGLKMQEKIEQLIKEATEI
jgi:hypothetical protein